MTSLEDNGEVSLPLPRLEVRNLHAYQAPLEGRRKLLRLDFNENTAGPSPLVLKALKSISSSEIAIYPEYDGLREAVINNLSKQGVALPLAPDQVACFNGVDAAIRSVFHAYGDRGDLLLTTTPTFGYYSPCAEVQGMRTLAIPYEGECFAFPFRQIKEALVSKSPRILVICNPNNPTGTRLSPHEIVELAELSPHSLVVVDELYEAFTGDSLLPFLNFKRTPNVVILRSLSKTAGLAGLRFGYAIGQSEIVGYLNRVVGPYDINSFAVTAAFAALEDQAYVDSYVKKVLSAKKWIGEKLKDSAFRHHLDGGNYFLVWPKNNPIETELALRKEGILVRNMRGKPLIEGSLRVSVGTIDQMQQFWECFSKIEELDL